ncbi:hypothetical protein BG07_4780 [Bacillus pseudomycoides]|nr:hypothetical protein DJ92_154 [Bacillus pseudomycoides]AJI18168.1 hypothetical protein BG07_4780 [Bacillus pseudomycoides]
MKDIKDKTKKTKKDFNPKDAVLVFFYIHLRGYHFYSYGL